MRLARFMPVLVLAFGLYCAAGFAQSIESAPPDSVTAPSHAPAAGGDQLTDTQVETGGLAVVVFAVIAAALRTWRFRTLLFKYAPVAFNLVNDYCARSPSKVDDKVGLFLVELGKLMGKELSPKEEAIAKALAGAMHGQEKAQEKILANAQVLAAQAQKSAASF